MRLAGKAALITGAATGIGAACARRFAAEGARVAIADINVERGEATAADCGGIFIRCDTGDVEQCRNAVNATVAAFGRIDILLCAAAHLGGNNPAHTMSADEWHAVNRVTLDGLFYCSKYAISAMLEQGQGGSIVHIASVEGMMGAAGHVAYVTAKSAVFGLTRSLAIDYGRHAIRCNAISPGIIDAGRPDIERFKQDPTVMQFWRDQTVLDRMGRPDEIAAAAVFLASDEASYVTGQNLAVDGGWTIGHPPLRWPSLEDPS